MNNLEKIFNVTEDKLKPVYLIYGEDSYLLHDCKKKFIERYISDEIRDFNYTFLDDEVEDFLATLKNQVNTPPFMADKRYIIARTSGYFTEKNGRNSLLIKLLQNFPETTVLLIIVEGKVDQRLKVVEEVKKIGEVINLKPPKYKELDKWIVNQFKIRGKIVDAGSVKLLEQMFNNELELLNSEIEKIITYKYDEKRITLRDVKEIISKDKLIEDNIIFSLTDALISKQKGRAVNILNEMIQQGALPLRILGTIIWQLRLFLSVKVLKREGKDPVAIAKILKSHQYPVKKCYHLSNNFTEEEMELMLERFLQANLHIVTGKYDARMALELAILED